MLWYITREQNSNTEEAAQSEAITKVAAHNENVESAAQAKAIVQGPVNAANNPALIEAMRPI